jgi:hypothetical protein
MGLCCAFTHGVGAAGRLQELQEGNVGHVGRENLCKLQSMQD